MNGGQVCTAVTRLEARLGVHFRWPTCGRSASRTPVSTARRLVHDGHHPRPLQLNATSRDVSQSSHATSTKPYRTSPHRWYASASRLTRLGTVSHTAKKLDDVPAQFRRKAHPVE
jgi:hypothetical protein